MKKLLIIMFLFAISNTIYALNNKTGISISFPGSTEGVDYAIEQFYYDAMYDDHSVVYVKSSATFSIALAHNANNINHTGTVYSGAEWDTGVITCLIDGDELYRWRSTGVTYYGGDTEGFATSEGILWEYNNTPFTIAEKSKGVGDNDAQYPHDHPNWYSWYTPEYWRHYHYGMLDSFGDEWHTLTYWDNDDSCSWAANDGKIIYFVVNPKAPCITFSTYTATAQYYTTPPKAFYKPIIRDQITYLTDGVKIILKNVTDETNSMQYKVDSGSWQSYSGEINTSDEFTNDTEHDFHYRLSPTSPAKTRKIHYNPSLPSQGETHPILLYNTVEKKNKIKDKIIGPNAREPFASHYTGRVKPVTFMNYRDGKRYGTQETGWPHDASSAAFVYRMENDLTYAEVAKQLLLSRSHDLLGFTMGQGITSGIAEFSVANTYQLVNWVIAYDLMVGYLTAVEEYKVRDSMANMARATIMRSWYCNNHGHMMNNYNLVAAAAIAMPTYDTVLGHAMGTERSENNSTSNIEPTPSFYDAVYDKDTNVNATGMPEYDTLGLWGLIRGGGRWDRTVPYYGWSCYNRVAEYGLFRGNYDDGVNLTELDDRFKNSILRHVFTRRPSDNHIMPYDGCLDGLRLPSYPLDYEIYMNEAYNAEYAPGKTIMGLAAFNRLVGSDTTANFNMRTYNNPLFLALYDDTITPVTPPDTYFSPAGFSFYSDISSPDSIFIYQHGEDGPLQADSHTRLPDQIYFGIDAYGQRFVPHANEYEHHRNDIGIKPGSYNNVLVDDTGDFTSGISVHTITETDKFFDNQYMPYGSVKNISGSPSDSSPFDSDVQQTRNIFFPDKRFFVLVDKMRSGNNHTYDWMFNGLGMVNTVGDHETIVNKSSGERLKVFYIGPDVTLTKGSFIAGTGYVKARAAQAQNLDFHVLMIPVDNGASTPSIHNKSSGDDYYASKITYDNNEFITFSQVDPVSRTAEGITIDADLAIVKLTDGAVDYFQANNCINLSVGSVEFLNSSERINITLKTNSDGYVYQIEPHSDSTTNTTLIIGGLTPSITYTLTDSEFNGYNGYKTQIAQYTFQSDADGKYTYVQNCSRHEIAIQSGDHVPVVNNPSGNNDTTAPVISNLRIIGIGSDKATIIWTTDEESTSRVEYGVNTSYGSISDVDSNLVTSHSITISGLSVGTEYHIRAISADASSNGALSVDYTFRTAVDDIEAKSYPNPYEYSENNPMTFEFPNIDDGGTLKMYTIAGKLIRTIELPVGEIRIQWDGKDENGFVVASGLYIYVLTTAEGKIKKGKFAFIK